MPRTDGGKGKGKGAKGKGLKGKPAKGKGKGKGAQGGDDGSSSALVSFDDYDDDYDEQGFGAPAGQ